MTGNLLGKTGKVEVRAAANGTHDFGVRVGDSETWMGVHALPTSARRHHKEPVHVRRNRKGTEVWVDIGPVHVKIAKPVKAKHHVWNWLNVFVNGMAKFKT